MVPVAIPIIAIIGSIWLIGMCIVLPLLYAFGERQEKLDANHTVTDGHDTHYTSSENADVAAD